MTLLKQLNAHMPTDLSNVVVGYACRMDWKPVMNEVIGRIRDPAGEHLIWKERGDLIVTHCPTVETIARIGPNRVKTWAHYINGGSQKRTVYREGDPILVENGRHRFLREGDPDY